VWKENSSRQRQRGKWGLGLIENNFYSLNDGKTLEKERE
jgi:hypothetical protein